MIDHRPFAKLGTANHGWLNAHFHFSFAEYFDPNRMGWGALRVWNDDEVAGKSGFPPHPHRDMEIITYVREGAVTHEDSMGNKGHTGPGDVQVMSAGTGVRHSEYNFDDPLLRLFQIWIIPDRPGGEPTWGSRRFPEGDRAGRFVTLASGYAEDADALPIRASARVLGASLKKGQTATYALDPARHAYLVSSGGRLEVNGVVLENRDGAAVTGETELKVTALEDGDAVLVDAA